MNDLSLGSGVQTWARELAFRVKMIQASWSDDPGAARAGAVRRELSQAFADVGRSERAERVAAVRRHFPDPGGAPPKTVQVTKEVVKEVVREVVKEVPKPQASRELTPSELIEKILLVIDKLPDAKRQELSASLARWEKATRPPTVLHVPSPPAGERVPTELARLLGLEEGQRVFDTRLMQVIEPLVRWLKELDDTADKVLAKTRELGGDRARLVGQVRSEAERPARCVGLYLGGDADVSRERMRLVIDRAYQRLSRFLRLPAALPADLAERNESILGEENLNPLVDRKMAKMPFHEKMLTTSHAIFHACYLDLWKTKGYPAEQVRNKLSSSEFWGQDFAKAVLKQIEGSAPKSNGAGLLESNPNEVPLTPERPKPERNLDPPR